MGGKISAKDQQCTHFRFGMKVRTSRFIKTLGREHCRVQNHSARPCIKSQEEMKKKKKKGLLLQGNRANIKYLQVLGFLKSILQNVSRGR